MMAAKRLYPYIEVEIVGDACATSVGMILEDDTHET